MGGDKQRPFVGIQKHGQEIAGVQAQNGPAVGADIAGPFKGGLKRGGGLKIRQDDEVMYLPRPAFPFVNRADFTG